MWISKLVFPLLLISFAGTAMAQSHAMVDRNRSSWQNNMFLTQSIEGEYGSFTPQQKEGELPMEKSWRGYGIRNGFGLEVYRFIQFSLAHTMFRERSKASSLETAQGSRLAGEIAMVFSAPIVNIQISYGLTASQMDYRNQDQSASYSGTGDYLGLGINYFFNPRISLQVLGKRLESRYSKDGGSFHVDSMRSKMDNLSLGLAVWL